MAKWSIRERSGGVFTFAFAAGLLFAGAANASPTATVALAAASNPSTYGQTVIFTATMTPPAITGKVTLFDGATPIGISSISAGSASFNTRTLAPGSHAVWALFGGNGSYAAAKSNVVQQVIRPVAQNGFNWSAAVEADTNPVWLTAADFNGDGRLDVAAANYGSGDVSVLIAQGGGTFRAPVNYPTGQNAAAIVASDFNGDGKPDLAVANSGANTISILLGNGDGTFQTPVSYAAASTPCSLATGDFNGDGVVDLAVTECTSASFAVLPGNADGTFGTALTYAAGLVPAFIASADFNADGYADVAIANAGDGTVSVAYANGNGTFQVATTFATNNYPLALAVADFNGDGRPDIGASGVGGVAVLLNNGGGVFAAAVSYPAGSQPYAIQAGDFNGDGATDLVVADSAGNSVLMLRGNGDGTFQSAAAGTWPAGNAPAFLASGDFNGDGIPDLAIADDGGGISILSGLAPPVLTINCLIPSSQPLLYSNSWTAPCSLLNGAAPYHWSVTSGTMPPGMFLSSTTGATVTVKGTPVIPGNYSFTVTATDSSTIVQSSSQVFSGAVQQLAATVSGVSPSAVPANSALFTLTVNGSGFQNGATVSWNGSPEPTTWISVNQLTATIPGSGTQAAGVATVAVVNPNAAGSNSVSLPIHALPAIASLSPAAVTAGAASFNLVVNGSAFVGGATVKWGGTPLATVFVSASQITAAVASSLVAAAGSVPITVSNPDTGVSSAATFTVSRAASGGGSGGGSAGGVPSGGVPSGGGGVPSSGGGASGGGVPSTGGGGSSGGVPSGGGGAASGGGSSGTAAITASVSSLNFIWTQGDPAPPAQTVALFSAASATGYSLLAQTGIGTNWLVTTASATNTPAFVRISVDTSVLSTAAAGTYTGQVSITGPASTLNIPVNLTIAAAAPPVIAVAPASVTFAAVHGGPAQAGQVTVSNRGGGAISYSAAVASSGWLKLLSGNTGSARASAPGVVAFAVDPSATGPGIFNGSVQITETASGRLFTVPVAFAVTGGSSTIALSQSALSFSATPQQPQPPAQTIAVSASGSNSITWTARTSASWLQISSVAGQSSMLNPAQLQVSVNASGLALGTYYGGIDFSSSDVANSPQSITVVLNVLASLPAGPAAPASGSSVTLMGSAQQKVTLAAAGAKSFTAIASANDGSWLSVSPSAGVPNNGVATLTVAANASAAGPGLHYGSVSAGFDDGTVQVIQVTLIAGGPSCTPSRLIVSAAAMAGGTAQAGLPQPMQIAVMDDCGNAATPANTSAQATFTNGDAAVNLAYAGTGPSGAVWQGAWIPATAVNSMQMQISASQGTLTAGSVTFPFTVSPADPNGAGIASAILNAASGTAPQTVTPGSYVAIYGSQLAAPGYGLATTTPFTSTLDGTQVLLGGQPLPLYYASPTQINALVPQNIAPNTVAQLVVQRGASRSMPVSVIVAPLQPAIFAQNQAGSGQGSIEISGTALLAAPASPDSRPAKRSSDYIAIYCTGLGPVRGENGEPPPADGVAAAYPPLYKTTMPVTVTIGGVDAPVVFAGLTPTLVGLYQVDAQVPAGVRVGDAVPVVIRVQDPATGAVVESNMVTIAVE